MHAAPGEIPSSSQQLKLQELYCSIAKVASYKRWQGSCNINCCDEEGFSPGAACIQMTPAKIPFFIPLLKIQNPVLLFLFIYLLHFYTA